MPRQGLKNVLQLLDEAEETISPDQSFLRDLKRSIELDDQKNRRAPSQMYKPSSLQCIRNMYYQRTGAESENSSSYTLIGIQNSGTDIHIRVQTAIDHMKENGIDCEYLDVAKFVEEKGLKDIEVVEHSGMETKLRNTALAISFMCDGVVRYKNQYYIIEIKSETVNKWFQRTGVDSKHLNQGTAYSLCLQIPDVIFIYVSRDTLDMKSFMFHPSDKQKEDLVSKILECENYVGDKTTPPMPAGVDKRVCQYCNYKVQCRKDG